MKNRFRQAFISEIAFCLEHSTTGSPSAMVRPILTRFDTLVFAIHRGTIGKMNNSERKFISRLNKFIKKGEIESRGFIASWDEPVCVQIDGTQRIRESTINYCSWLFYWIADFFYNELEDYLDFNERASTDWRSIIEYEICAGMCCMCVEYISWQYENGKEIFRGRK